jgi:exodeoxyribonuclease VII large subunit
MSGRLLQKLRKWRDKEAKRRGTDDYRVLQNRSLEEIAKTKPDNKQELLEVYGIAETKYNKYGDKLLKMVSGTDGGQQEEEAPISVSAYLTKINDLISEHTARVKGEVVEYDIRENYLFFTIKDEESEAAMQCFMWRREYDVSDVALEEGLEIAVTGVPEIYKPNGRFTFRAATLELVGEGALKKAYDKLKAKLDEAGLFAEEAKQDLPAFPQTIGLITSKESDAYHDFLANLGNFGFSVQFFPSRVQGAKSVTDLIEALDYFADNESALDALVITRGGGGNLEVLQAFNNEAVVKKLSDLDIPVITGIGHERDVPLAAMAADVSVSTPTACAEILHKSWETLAQRIQQLEDRLIRSQELLFTNRRRHVERLTNNLENQLETILTSFRKVVSRLTGNLQTVGHRLKRQKQLMAQLSKELISAYQSRLDTVENTLDTLTDQLKRVDPQRRLDQGYSIVRGEEGVVSSIDDVGRDADISVQVSDGIINANANTTHANND